MFEIMKEKIKKAIVKTFNASGEFYASILDVVTWDDIKEGKGLYDEAKDFLEDFGPRAVKFAEKIGDRIDESGIDPNEMFEKIISTDEMNEIQEAGMALFKSLNETNGTTYVANAFSLNMLEENDVKVMVEATERDDIPESAVSVIGHEDTANVLGFDYNRATIRLRKGDILYVAQLIGGRLPEGSTTLPKNMQIRWSKVTLR
ncbi:MAG: hypothetical protein SVK08_00120 [Halobacteriota archaeon]|nr:hypothetical protein [Halobacteriota archaeon]